MNYLPQTPYIQPQIQRPPDPKKEHALIHLVPFVIGVAIILMMVVFGIKAYNENKSSSGPEVTLDITGRVTSVTTLTEDVWSITLINKGNNKTETYNLFSSLFDQKPSVGHTYHIRANRGIDGDSQFYRLVSCEDVT